MRYLLCAFLFIGLGNIAWGDKVYLLNSDQLNGKVVSLNDKELILKSDTLGEIKIPREKIMTIHLGEVKIPYQMYPEPPTFNALPYPTLAPTTLQPSAEKQREPGLEDIFKKLQNSKELSGNIEKLEGEFPLLMVPEVRKYFDDTVGGLITGEVSIESLRKQAIEARNQVKELEAELGPQGADALKPYMSILDKFIRESEKSPSKTLPKPERDKPGINAVPTIPPSKPSK
jgi:hypothetical protein